MRAGFFCFVISVSFLFNLFALASTESLTVERAISEAKERNPRYLRARNVVEGASWKKLEALSSYLPKISASANRYFDNKFQITRVTIGANTIRTPALYPYAAATFDASLLVFDGFAGWYNYQGARLDYESAELQYARAGFELEQEVTLRFYRALANQLLNEVARQNLQTLEQHLADARARERSGFATKFDTLRIEVQLEDARAELISSEDNVVIARMELAASTGVENDPRAISGLLPGSFEKRDPVLNVLDRADIQAQTRQEQSLSKVSQASGSWWVPRVSLFGNTQYYNNTDRSIASNFSNAYAYGLSLVWPLFDGGASYARRHQAFFRAEEGRRSLDATFVDAAVNFQKWKRKYVYSISLLQARQRAITKAEESVRLAMAGVRAGTRTNTELLDAELDLFRARAGVVRAQLEGEEALLNLELAVGKKF